MLGQCLLVLVEQMSVCRVDLDELERLAADIPACRRQKMSGYHVGLEN